MPSESNIFMDIFTNLVSEGIGILITVFIIDRLIKSREEKRWRPAKDILHRDLFEQSRAVLAHLTLLDQKNPSNIIYIFGGRKAGAVPNMSLRFSSRNDFVTLPKKIQGLLDKHLIDKNVLNNYMAFIDKTITQSAHIIEPELLSILLQIQEYLEYTDQLNLSDNSFNLYFTTTSIGELMEWLKVIASETITVEDSKKQLEKLKQDIREIQEG